MNKIQRTSWFFRMVFQLIFVILPLITITVWIYAPNSVTLLGGQISLHAFQVHIPVVQMTLGTKILGFIVDLIPLTVNLFVLYFLIKLFRLYEQGEIFTLNNVHYIRNTGYALLIGQLINPIYQALLSLILTWHNPKGMHYISISLSGTNVGVLLGSLLVILISWIMAEGYKLQEEQQLTI